MAKATGRNFDIKPDDSEWITLNSFIQYRKVNNIVEVRGYSTTQEIQNYTLVGTLPIGFRPTITVQNPLALSGGNQSVSMYQILTSGEIRCYNSTSTAYWQFYISFIT